MCNILLHEFDVEVCKITLSINNIRNKKVSEAYEDPNYRKLEYVRYADDFLLGFIGPKSEAISILSRLVNLLWFVCKLEVNPEKVSITHHRK